MLIREESTRVFQASGNSDNLSEYLIIDTRVFLSKDFHHISLQTKIIDPLSSLEDFVSGKAIWYSVFE